MDSQEISEILKKYQEGTLNAKEESLLEIWIEEGVLNIDEIKELRLLSNQLEEWSEVDLPKTMDRKFWKWMHLQKKANFGNVKWWDGLLSKTFTFRTAITSMIIFGLGITIGILIANQNQETNQLVTLQNEVTSMRQIMMISLLEKESTGDRLKAVSIVEEFDDVNQQIVEVLLNTIREDENTNVRLAALNALYPYADKAMVREGLIQCINFQNSPLVLLKLADLMVALEEKKSVEEFRKQLQNELPEEVKVKLENSIEKLI